MYYVITFAALFIFCIAANFVINMFKKGDKGSISSIIFEAFLIAFIVSVVYTVLTLFAQ